MPLTKEAIRIFKSKSQTLKPVVIIGDKGLTDNVMNEINVALDAHELIKIRVNAEDKTQRQAFTDQICEDAQAEFIASIGHVITIYRKKSKPA